MTSRLYLNDAIEADIRDRCGSLFKWGLNLGCFTLGYEGGSICNDIKPITFQRTLLLDYKTVELQLSS